MVPWLKPHEAVKVRRLDEDEPVEYGMIVLCTIQGIHKLELVRAVQDHRVLVGNARGLSGWTPRKQIHGVVTQ